MWGVGCGVWGVGREVWGVRCGVWAVGCTILHNSVLVSSWYLNCGFAISACRLRERGRVSKTVYVRVFHDLELLR